MLQKKMQHVKSVGGKFFAAAVCELIGPATGITSSPQWYAFIGAARLAAVSQGLQGGPSYLHTRMAERNGLAGVL